MARTDARAAMIDAAERIVAERGLAALTLREVQAESGQANKSAAQYHFGSRQGLLEAVIEERMRPVDELRQRALEALDTLDHAPSTRELVAVLVRPLAASTLAGSSSFYARFLAQSIHAPELSAAINKHLRAESYRQVSKRIIDNSALPVSIAGQRLSNAMVLVLISLAAYEAQPRSRFETDAIVNDLITTCVAVLDAPSTIEGA